MDLLDLVEDAAAASSGQLRFLGRDPEPRRFDELWNASGIAGSWLARTVGQGGRVAALLAPTFESVATLIGAWRRGITIASLPAPVRGADGPEVKERLDAMCRLVGAAHLLADPAVIVDLPELAAELHPFDVCLASAPCGTDEPGRFVQFTSGSTGSPRAVGITLEALGANITAILDVLSVGGREAVCSWLPLSHDMGLVGMLLAPLAAPAARWRATMDLTLLPTDRFLAFPRQWLRACSERQVTITAMPNFGCELTARALRRTPNVDLGSMRAWIVGAERVEAATLRRITEAGAPFGLRPEALCPAYGLAEATLAVALVPPEAHWSSVTVDPIVLAAGGWKETSAGDGAAVELVGNGPCLPDVECRVGDGGDGPGELHVRGPSIAGEFIGVDHHLDGHGWLATGDIGVLRGGELFCVGRLDDQIVLLGRNYDGRELARVAAEHRAVRAGACIAVQTAGGYAIVAEAASAAAGDLRSAARAIRAELGRRSGASPSSIVFVSRGSLPRTPSGKLRGAEVRRLVSARGLDVELAVDFADDTVVP